MAAEYLEHLFLRCRRLEGLFNSWFQAFDEPFIEKVFIGRVKYRFLFFFIYLFLIDGKYDDRNCKASDLEKMGKLRGYNYPLSLSHSFSLSVSDVHNGKKYSAVQ